MIHCLIVSKNSRRDSVSGDDCPFQEAYIQKKEEISEENSFAFLLLVLLFKKSMEKERKLLNQHLLSFKIRRKIIRKAERIWRIWVIQKVITVSKIQKSDHPMLPRCSYEKV